MSTTTTKINNRNRQSVATLLELTESSPHQGNRPGRIDSDTTALETLRSFKFEYSHSTIVCNTHGRYFICDTYVNPQGIRATIYPESSDVNRGIAAYSRGVSATIEFSTSTNPSHKHSILLYGISDHRSISSYLQPKVGYEIRKHLKSNKFIHKIVDDTGSTRYPSDAPCDEPHHNDYLVYYSSKGLAKPCIFRVRSYLLTKLTVAEVQELLFEQFKESGWITPPEPLHIECP